MIYEACDFAYAIGCPEKALFLPLVTPPFLCFKIGLTVNTIY